MTAADHVTVADLRVGRALYDLLEREGAPLPITEGRLLLDLPAHGFAAVRVE